MSKDSLRSRRRGHRNGRPAVRLAVAGADGTYRFFGLPTSTRWDIRVALSGFRGEGRTIEGLGAGEHRLVDFRLEPAAVSERVEVTPDVPIARTTTPELGGALSERQIEELPVNGRDLISPGVSDTWRRAGAWVLQPGPPANHQRIVLTCHELHRRRFRQHRPVSRRPQGSGDDRVHGEPQCAGQCLQGRLSDEVLAREVQKLGSPATREGPLAVQLKDDELARGGLCRPPQSFQKSDHVLILDVHGDHVLILPLN